MPKASIDPVLAKLHDCVLALEHSLDARAVGARAGELAPIQADVVRLSGDMNASIARAGESVRRML